MRIPILLVAAWLALPVVAPAAPPIETYGHLPGVELMRLSPTGERYAFIAVLGESRKLGVVTDDGKLLYSSAVGDAKVRGIDWVDDERLLVTLTSTYDKPLEFRQAYELSSVLDISLAGGKPSAIFEKSRGIAHAVFGHYGSARIDGQWHGYFGGITLGKGSSGYYFDHGYADLYQVNFETGRTSLADRGSMSSQSWAIAADGTLAAHSDYDDKTGQWRLFAGKDSKKLLFERMDPLGDAGLSGLGRSAGTVLIEYRSDDDDIVEEVSLADGKREGLLEANSTSEYLRDPESGILLGALTSEEPKALFFDRRLQARYNGARKAFPDYQVELVSFSRGLDRMIVMTDGGDDSGTYWLVDIASGAANEIGRAYPAIRSADVGPTQRVKYPAADGLEIEAVLTLPPGRKAEQLPLVVMPHGGPIGVSDRPGFDYWAQAYAANGYAVLQPNFRGSSGYGREFREAGFGQWGRKMQTDVSDGVAALAARGVIDPKRVCIVGASYGGYAALAGVTLQQGLYRCAVSVAGVSDLQAFFNWEAERHGIRSDAVRFWRAAIGEDKEGGVVMRTLSPARLAERADAPVLLIHGKDDTVVPIEQSEKMATALKGAGKPVEYVVMPGEDHWLSRETTRTAMLKAAVAFVQKHNPP